MSDADSRDPDRGQLDDLLGHLRDTEEALSRARRCLAADPDELGMRMTMASLEKRLARLRDRLAGAEGVTGRPGAGDLG